MFILSAIWNALCLRCMQTFFILYLHSPCCTLIAGMYENNNQFAEKKQAGDSEACFAWCHSKHIYQPLFYFHEVPLTWPHPWDMQRHKCRNTTKHMSAYTHASRKTHKKKCRCYVIKDALCWFRLGEACGQEMDTWTFCGCFSEWSEVKHSYGWKTSVIWCQRFPDTWQKELWSHNKQFPSMHDCLKCIFGHVWM